MKITGGAGVLLVAGEAFGWRPWEAGRNQEEGNGGMRLVNGKGQWEVGDEAWGLLGLLWPKPGMFFSSLCHGWTVRYLGFFLWYMRADCAPDLLILGLGKEMRPISPKTRQFVNSLGIRIDIQDTRNAAAQFNLLATERGVGSVAAALIPLGWKEGVGVL